MFPAAPHAPQVLAAATTSRMSSASTAPNPGRGTAPDVVCLVNGHERLALDDLTREQVRLLEATEVDPSSGELPGVTPHVVHEAGPPARWPRPGLP